SENPGLSASWAAGCAGWLGFNKVNGMLSASKCCVPGTGGGIVFRTENSGLSTSKLLGTRFPELAFKTEKEGLSLSKTGRPPGWLPLSRVKAGLSASRAFVPGLVALVLRVVNSALSASKLLTTWGCGGAVFRTANGALSDSWKMGVPDAA